jgi:hypothetical protein
VVSKPRIPVGRPMVARFEGDSERPANHWLVLGLSGVLERRGGGGGETVLRYLEGWLLA